MMCSSMDRLRRGRPYDMMDDEDDYSRGYMRGRGFMRRFRGGSLGI
jgi:hypothetical protein